MGSARFGSFLVILGFIGLVASCGSMEQLDFERPVKPLPKVIDMAMVDRIRRMNKNWYPVDNK
ncbi:MAG: hypothetical protein COB36_11960 [Alphaproteobacteria bacterium]|nr:MAG: hypothetical protein COB36_11960 [Alphaproteobacteria bacterium]